LIFLGIVVVAVVIGLLVRNGKDGGGFNRRDAIDVRLQSVSTRTITETVTASGKLFPKTEVSITPEISGELVALYVADGDSVIAGQNLAEIDPEIFLSDVQRMEATLSGTKAAHASAKANKIRAEANMVTAQANYNRIKGLLADKVESQANFEAAEAQYQSAKADVAVAEENVKSAWYTVQSTEQTLRQLKEQLSRTKLIAPISGLVSGLTVKVGETVLGTSMMSGTTLMKIVDLARMEVHVDVSESDVLRIRLGDTALVDVDAYLDRRFTGIVTEVATAASGDQFASSEQATNYKVEIALLRESYADLLGADAEGGMKATHALFPGMSATAEIKTRVAYDVLAVPIQAVTTREDTTAVKGRQLRVVVFTNQDGLARETEVVTGVQDDDYIEIREGLEAGWEIVSGPYRAVSRELQDSVAIKVKD
jgi:HlyD family secretion protein